MSFALEYRKKMQSEESIRRLELQAIREASAGFVTHPAEDSYETRGNKRRVLAAISLALIILSVFNSRAMVHYAGGLTDSEIGMQLITATESWHQLMQDTQITQLTDGIRDTVQQARHTQWPDLASALSFSPSRLMPGQPGPVKPARNPGDNPPAGNERLASGPQALPLLRAAVD
jgi:hypothetical protein